MNHLGAGAAQREAAPGPVTRKPRLPTASRRLLERQGFRLTSPLPGTDKVRYTLGLS
jgi:hypothetical protein